MRGAFPPETGGPLKWKARMKDWPWQFLFPQKNLSLLTDNAEVERDKLEPSSIAKRNF